MIQLEKELKRMNRRELVDIIYQLKKNEQELQGEIDNLKNEIQNQRIRISLAGSIADASMSVTNVFSVAQMTADVYLREIACMKEDTEKECARRIEEAEQKVQDILKDGKKKFTALKKHYKQAYAKWQQLQAEITALEQKKQRTLGEGTDNG
ncbi:MAG: hypothetical protein IKU26_01730 [Clostridia bacterium]|nr:hypothetical protein [Clostridia bacterium]